MYLLGDSSRDHFYPRTLEVTNNFSKGHFTIPKKITKNCQATNMDTQNDGLEKGNSL